MKAALKLSTYQAGRSNGRSRTGLPVLLASLCAVALCACTTTAHQIGDAHPVTANVATHAPQEIDETRELRVAQTALQGGDLEMATNIYGRIMQHNPQSVPGLTGLGDTLYAVADYTRADVYYHKAISFDPRAVPALIGTARVAIQRRRFDVAVSAYRKVLAIKPDDALAAAGLGAALDMLGDHAAAQASMRSALDVNPGDIGLSINLGLSLVMDGKLREGADMLLDVTHFPGAPAQARYDLALAYGLMGDDTEAARLLSDLPKKAVEDNLRYYATMRAQRMTAVAAAAAAAAPRVPAATAQTPVAARPAAAAPIAGANSAALADGNMKGRLTQRLRSPFDDSMDGQPSRLAAQAPLVQP